MIPKLLNYQIYDNQIVKNERSGIVTLIHWGNDFNKDIVDWVEQETNFLIANREHYLGF